MRRFTTHFKKSVSALVLVISFFFVGSIPVMADYDYDTFTIEPYQVIAYMYWNKMGYETMYTLTHSTTIAVPSFRTDTGNTNDRLICNASGTSYSCYYLGSSGNTGTFQFETTRAHDETEQNISVHGAEIPWLTGTYIHDNAYNSNTRALFLPGSGDLYISFITTVNTFAQSDYAASDVPANRHVQVYSQDGVTNQISVELLSQSQINGCYWLTFKFHNNDSTRHWLNINFPRLGTGNAETKIIPYYVGSATDLPDSIKQSLNIPTNTELSLNNISEKMDAIATNSQKQVNEAQKENSLNEFGNAFSQNRQQALSEQNSELSNKVNQMNTIESNYSTSLNTALDDINLDTDLVQHSGFTNAALWVGAQFNRLVIGTPFELVIMFSLVTGLALVLIGKLRS